MQTIKITQDELKIDGRTVKVNDPTKIAHAVPKRTNSYWHQGDKTITIEHDGSNTAMVTAGFVAAHAAGAVKLVKVTPVKADAPAK